MADKDILEMIIPAARERHMKIIPEMMEPLFAYSGHGSATKVMIPNPNSISLLKQSMIN